LHAILGFINYPTERRSRLLSTSPSPVHDIELTEPKKSAASVNEKLWLDGLRVRNGCSDLTQENIDDWW
jgi:hypothetical protein